MSMNINDWQIDRIHIIDDDEESRQVLEYTVADTDVMPVIQNERIDNLSNYLNEFIGHQDAVVSDHHLKKKNYFPVNGAEVIFQCYKRRIPSVLVTKYEQAEIVEIRKRRRNIPVILNPDEFDPETLLYGLSTCINEFKGVVLPERKLWRTLIQVDDVSENSNFFIIIPSWNPQETISINKSELPPEISSIIKPDMRLHARANIGADNVNDLFFTDWEPK